MGQGFRGANGQPAAPPYTQGPYDFSEFINFQGGVGGSNRPGKFYYTDRNAVGSGDGSSWGNAFTTITAGINALNADYSASRQIGSLFIGEGYYPEEPVTLTASDAWIVAVSPGGHDSTVFWGNGVAGSWTPSATGAPALTIEGDNNTIYGLGVVNRSGGLYPAIKIADGALANHLVRCKITKDAADSCTYGIEDMGNAFTRITECEFSTSCKTAGIRLYSATNHSIQIIIEDCIFYGCPSGITVDAAAHNALIRNCTFLDDNSDTPDVCDTPILNEAGSSLTVRDCYSLKAADTGASGDHMITGSAHASTLRANLFQLAA